MINYHIPFSRPLKVNSTGTWRATVAVPTVITDSHQKHLRRGNTVSVSITEEVRAATQVGTGSRNPGGCCLPTCSDSQLTLSFLIQPRTPARNAGTHNGRGSSPSVNNNQDNPHRQCPGVSPIWTIFGPIETPFSRDLGSVEMAIKAKWGN